MKKRLFTSLAIALILIATLALPAVAGDVGTVTASVTVNSEINVTITDGGAANIVFGALAAGSNNNPDTTASDTVPSVSISVNGTAIVDLQVSGTNFGTGFPVTQTKFNTTYSTTGTTAMATTPVQIADEVAPNIADVDVWFWLDVPASGITAGGYSSTFTFAAIED